MEITKKPELFVGKACTRTLDDKSRISLPARFRAQLERSQKEYDSVYVFCAPHRKELCIYTYDGWLEFAQPKIDAVENPKDRIAFSNRIYSLLDEQTVDSQGRLKLDKDFLKAIGVDMLTLANDHALDAGMNGLLGTIITAAKEETNPFDIDDKTADFIDSLYF